MKLTYNQIVEFGPCYDPVKYIPKDWSGTVIDILKMKDVSAKDRLWVAVRHQLLTDRQIHLYGLGCARLSEKYSTDPRVKECNDTVELYLAGKATKEQLSAARSAAWSAESAAWSAARSAARSAAWSAESAAESAESAAWSAARSAAWSAESAAEQQQCELLISIIEDTK